MSVNGYDDRRQNAVREQIACLKIQFGSRGRENYAFAGEGNL